MNHQPKRRGFIVPPLGRTEYRLREINRRRNVGGSSGDSPYLQRNRTLFSVTGRQKAIGHSVSRGCGVFGRWPSTDRIQCKPKPTTEVGR